MHEELINVWRNINSGETFEREWGWFPGRGPYTLVKTYIKKCKK